MLEHKIIFFLLCFICSMFCAFKQSRCTGYTKDQQIGSSIGAAVFGPFWLLGALINQFVIKDWR